MMACCVLPSAGLQALLAVVIFLAGACASPSEGPQDFTLHLTRAPQGFYTVRLSVMGQQSRFLVDTGSGDTWIPQGPASLASTAQKSIPGRPFRVAYGSGSASGTVQEGVVSFPGGPSGNCEYGLATREEGQLQELTGEVDGIWGLAPGGGIEGLLQCLAREGKISRQVMSLHLTEEGGTVSIGDVPKGLDVHKIPVIGNGKTWSVPLLSVFVQRHESSHSSKPKSDLLGGPQPALLDSGSSGLRAPSAAIEHLAWALAAERNDAGKFVIPCESRLQPPDIILRLGSEASPVDVSLNIQHLMGENDGRGWCSLSLNPSSSGEWILGGTFFRRVQAVVFDYQNSQVSVAVGADSTPSGQPRPRASPVSPPMSPPQESSHLKNVASAALRPAAATGAVGADKGSSSWHRIGEDIQGDAGEMGIDVRPKKLNPDVRQLMAGRFGVGADEGSPVGVTSPTTQIAEAPLTSEKNSTQRMESSPLAEELHAENSPLTGNGTQWKDVSKDLSNPVESAEMSDDIAKENSNQEESKEEEAMENAAEAAQQEAKQAGLSMPSASSIPVSPAAAPVPPGAEANSTQTHEAEPSAVVSSQPGPSSPLKIHEIVDYFNDHSDPQKLSDQIKENKETDKLAKIVKSQMPGAKVDDGVPHVQLPDSEGPLSGTGASSNAALTNTSAAPESAADVAPSNSDATTSNTESLAPTPPDISKDGTAPVPPSEENRIPPPPPLQGDGGVDTNAEPVQDSENGNPNTKVEDHAESIAPEPNQVNPVAQDADHVAPVIEKQDFKNANRPNPVTQDADHIEPVMNEPDSKDANAVAQVPNQATAGNPVTQDADHVEHAMEKPESNNANAQNEPVPPGEPTDHGQPVVAESGPEDGDQSESSTNALAPGPPPKDPPKKLGGPAVVPPLSAQAGIVGGLVPGGFKPNIMGAAASPVQDAYPSIQNPNLPPTSPIEFSVPMPTLPDQQLVPPTPMQQSSAPEAPEDGNVVIDAQPLVSAPAQDVAKEASVVVEDAEPAAIRDLPSSGNPVQPETSQPTVASPNQGKTAPANPVATTADDAEEDRLRRETSRWDGFIKRSEERNVPITASSSSASPVADEPLMPNNPVSARDSTPAPLDADLSHFDMGRLMDMARETVKAQTPENWGQISKHDHHANAKAPQSMKPLKQTMKRIHHADVKQAAVTATSADDGDDYGFGNLMDRARDAMAKLDESSDNLEGTEPRATQKALNVVVGQKEELVRDADLPSSTPVQAAPLHPDIKSSAQTDSSPSGVAVASTQAPLPADPEEHPTALESSPKEVVAPADSEEQPTTGTMESFPKEVVAKMDKVAYASANLVPESARPLQQEPLSGTGSPPLEDTSSDMAVPPARDIPSKDLNKRLIKVSQKKPTLKHLPTSSQQGKAELDDLDKVAQDAARWAQQFQKAATPTSEGRELTPESAVNVAPVTMQAAASSSPSIISSVPQVPSDTSEHKQNSNLPDSQLDVIEKGTDLENPHRIKVRGAQDVDNLAAEAQHWAHRWHVKAKTYHRVSTETDVPTQAAADYSDTPIVTEGQDDRNTVASSDVQRLPDVQQQSFRSPAKVEKVQTTGLPFQQTDAGTPKNIAADDVVAAPVAAAQAQSSWLNPDHGNAVREMPSAARTFRRSVDAKPEVQGTGLPPIDHLMAQADAWARLYHKHREPRSNKLWKASTDHPDLSLSISTARLRGRSDLGSDQAEQEFQSEMVPSKVPSLQPADGDPYANLFGHAEQEEQGWLARYRKH